jgi:hypothetical protein
MPYSQLDRTSRSIRLLILSPHLHPEDNRIQCRLFITSLDEFPSYDALSYTWGQPDELNLKIWVNGVLIPVRRNLLCALRMLRGDVERVLWIDALCINQNDEQERGHQVEMMGEIYKMAYWVLAWLGTPDIGESQDRIDIIGHQAPSKSVLAFDFLEVASQRSDNRYSQQFNHYKWMDDFVHNPALNCHWKELADICNLEYWTRLWIIQEVCLASKLRVLHGTKMIDWTAFRNFYSVISLYPLDRQDGSHLRRPDVNYSYMDRIVNSQPWKLVMYGRFEPSSPMGGPTLKSLLELSMPCSCHDQKDKVYGILGLASDVPVGEIPVDYSQSLFQLYTSVMRFMLRKVPRYSADAILIPFSQLLQRTILGPGPMFDKLSFEDILKGRYEMVLRQPLRENFLRTTGWTIGTIAIESSNPAELWRRSCKAFNPSRFRQRDSKCEKRTSITCSLWRKNLHRIWEADGDSFALFLHCFCGKSPKSTSRLTREGFSAGLTMFVTDELAVGVGPKGIQPGDKLWKFHGDRFFAVIRGQGDHFKVLGRAVIADKELVWGEKGNGLEMPYPSFVGEEYKIGRGPETQVDIDISVLQALTCPFRWKGFRRGELRASDES